LLLEPHTYAVVQEIGQARPVWYGSEGGLFSPEPHLVLQENFWHAEEKTTTQRYFVVDARSGAVTHHASTMQAYTEAGYRALLDGCGFAGIEFFASLTGRPDDVQPGLLAIVARKGEV
jgi:hypothetical protein